MVWYGGSIWHYHTQMPDCVAFVPFSTITPKCQTVSPSFLLGINDACCDISRAARGHPGPTGFQSHHTLPFIWGFTVGNKSKGPRVCNTGIYLGVHMLRPCYAHVTHMLRTCYAHVTPRAEYGMQYITDFQIVQPNENTTAPEKAHAGGVTQFQGSHSHVR